MKIVVAIDSLKGSLSSIEAGNAIKEGINKVLDAHVCVKPLADGGEGTVEALVEGMNGKIREVEVSGPLNHKVKAKYGIVDNLAIIEIASCAGITLVKERNPMYTSTIGVGEMILDAIDLGCRRFVIGIGGSSTNDGGVGMLQGLGYHFLDKHGCEIRHGAIGLKDLASIDDSDVNTELYNCEFMIACDVNNPLCGINGASYVYGPQKGADEAMVKELDGLLHHLSMMTKQYNPQSLDDYPGCGAAGGLGFAFYNYLNGKLESGIDLILKEIDIEKDIKDADLVITGEGQLDFQTAMGKAPIGVAKLSKKYNKKVIAFAGSVTKDAKACNEQGIDAYFPIIRGIQTLDEAMDHDQAKNNMIDTVEQVMRLIKVWMD